MTRKEFSSQMVELAASERAAKQARVGSSGSPSLPDCTGAGLEGVDDHEIDGQQRQCCEQQQDGMAAERAQVTARTSQGRRRRQS